MNKQLTKRGSDLSSEPRFLIIGRIRKPHGVRGELKVSVLTDTPKRLTWLETVYISRKENDLEPKQVGVGNVRFQGEDALLMLDGYTSRELAGTLRQHWLMIPIEEAIPLEEGEYYAYQAIGLIVSTVEGDVLGHITQIIETGANDVFVVMGDEGEILLPDIPDVVQEVNIAEQRMIVTLLPGLLG